MNRLNVLIYQEHASQQISLHQAFNAQGLFNVRVAGDMRAAVRCLGRDQPLDLLVLDHAMAGHDCNALLELLERQIAPKALLFVGRPRGHQPNLANQARVHGLWVLAELPWPVSAVALEQALRCLSSMGQAGTSGEFKTVMLCAHAR